MTSHIERRRQPTLLDQPSKPRNTLLDLMYDGFYAVFLLAQGGTPSSAAALREKLLQFLDEFEGKARKAGLDPEDIGAAKYAFCATADEIVMRSSHAMRIEWECRPLQLGLFGDQLAGENFFTRLEDLRAAGQTRLQAMEVFHMCLLLGFQGKYLLNGSEKIDNLVRRLGEEIARIKGRGIGLAPHAARPDQVVNALHSDRATWAACAVFGLLALVAYGGFTHALARDSRAVATADGLIRPIAPPPRVVIALP